MGVMKSRDDPRISFRLGLITIALVAAAGCSGSSLYQSTDSVTSSAPLEADPKLNRACGLLAEAYIRYSPAMYLFLHETVMPDSLDQLESRLHGLSDQVRSARVAAPSTIRDRFAGVEEAAEEYEMYSSDSKKFEAYELAVDGVMRACVEMNVSMKTFDWDTGTVKLYG